MPTPNFAPPHGPKEVVVYTADPCPYCSAAKALLSQRGVAYREVEISYDGTDWEDLQAITGMRTVPQIFFGERVIGGHQDLVALDRNDQLASIK